MVDTPSFDPTPPPSAHPRAEAAPLSVPDARRSEDGGMALVKAAVESANDAILITEATLELPGPRIEYVNPAFERMTGYGVEEIVGQTPRILQGPKTERALLQRLRGDLVANESFHGETVNYRKDGSEYFVEWRITPLRDPVTHEVTKWVAIQRDVTERVREQHARDSRLAAEQAARAEAERVGRMKDEFLATLSHELRTPLTAILGWARILHTPGGGPPPPEEELTQGLEIIERNARAQAQLVEDLLDMSRIISGQLRLEVRSLRLAEVVLAALASVEHAARAKEITLLPALDPQAPAIQGDPHRLQQVFWNLLSNAIKFTPRGGRVEVRQRLAEDNACQEILVRDSGQGIAPEFLPFVFDRFRQADNSSSRREGGLGLGLSLVRSIVELHGGNVSVHSEGVNNGATFCVCLPEWKAEGAREKPTPPVAGDGAPTVEPGRPDDAARGWADLAGLRLLLVEDQDDQRRLLRRVLEARGARVEVAADASTGLECFARFRPDLLICDIGLPGVNGYEFLSQVRALPAEEGGGTPAVALTAYARAEDRQRALRAGYQSHLAKPVEPEALATVVAKLAGANAGT